MVTDYKPLILITNDDGILAPGIQSLIKVAAAFGDLLVIAPDSPQSGQGHAITIETPIQISPVDISPDIEAYECTGTPVDCVKIATNVLLKDRPPDLCLSGINHGSNASINILYSGTMSAAMEASLEGIPSIGFSLLNFSHEADMGPSEIIVRKILQYVLEHRMSDTLLWNVNIPDLPIGEINGIRVVRQAKGNWVEEFQEGVNPRGRKYYWLTGKFVSLDEGEDTDLAALEAGYVSIVPSCHDLTHYTALEANKKIESISLTAKIKPDEE